jgi:endonuclease I
MVRRYTLRFNRYIRLPFSLVFVLFWAQLAFATIPPGYYDPAAGLSGAVLKTALYNIIKGHDSQSYTYLWTAFYTTDERSDNSTQVWDMYSDIPGGTPPYIFTLGDDQCGSAGAEGDCYSREHTFPKSWFGGEVSPMYTDLFQIVPSDQYVNNMKSDHPFGRVTYPTWTSLNGGKRGPCSSPGYTGVVFEPIDEYKGDFARNYMYMATRYENIISGWQNYNDEGKYVLNGTSYPCYYSWFINLLLDWNTLDPVSQKELDRNEAVYAIQDNRNPFIDHPEYANMIWAPSLPVATTTAATSIATTSATLNGSVNPNGYSTTWHFDWGTSIAYGSSTTPVSAGSGTSAVNVNSPISGLLTGTLYHFRLVAVNSNGTTNGNDLTFTTLTPSLTVTPSNRSVPSSAGSTTFTVTSNSSWTANSNQTWCTVTPSGAGNGTITANYSLNATTDQRVANVTVTVSGLAPVIVTVTQAGAAPTLSVTPSDRPVTSASGNTTFSVTSNTTWTVSSDQTWCTVTPSGSGAGTITATYSQNTTTTQRIANVTVTVTGLTPVVVTVTQAGSSQTLSVTPANQDVLYSAGTTAFSITSNSDWSAVSDQTWCTVTPSGSGDGTITANYSENTTSSLRIANITVTVTGLTPVTVTVTQSGIPLAPEPTHHVTDFNAYNIIVHWTDATGPVVPHGYLVRMSMTGFSSIENPVDGVPVADSDSDKNVASGVQEAWFRNLTPNTTYYFKIFGYQGGGSSIDYKTDGVIPQSQSKTRP